MMSREGIARLKAERRGRRRVLRVGVAEEEGRGQEEEQGLVTGEVKPREVGMRYEVLESRSYGTLSL